MRALVCIAALLCLSAAVASAQLTTDPDFSSFTDYVHRFQKKYANIDEFMDRFATYKNNLKLIAERNAEDNGGNVHGVNKFTDMSPQEFRNMYLNYVPAGQRPHVEVLNAPAVSANVTSFDWRDKGAVTPVKDQAQCGSCWAFSATEEIESCWFLAGNKLPVLSPQQIVSCDKVDAGCSGGDTITAYAYVQKAGGVESDADYPYTSGGGNSGTCKFDASKIVATMKNYSYATPPCMDSCNKQNETTLLNSLVSTAPVSICVYAEPWQTYTGGILKAGCPHSYSVLDHCVQLVGFNSEGATPYWIIRNSWNTDWGEDGYIYVAMGGNVCGVADEATIVSI